MRGGGRHGPHPGVCGDGECDGAPVRVEPPQGVHGRHETGAAQDVRDAGGPGAPASAASQTHPAAAHDAVVLLLHHHGPRRGGGAGAALTPAVLRSGERPVHPGTVFPHQRGPGSHKLPHLLPPHPLHPQKGNSGPASQRRSAAHHVAIC